MCNHIRSETLWTRVWVYLISLRAFIVPEPPNGAVDSTRIEQVNNLVRVSDIEDFVYTSGDVQRHGESGDV